MIIIKLKKQLSCLRCGYQWNPRKAEVRICPKCKSAWFDQPRKVKLNDS